MRWNAGLVEQAIAQVWPFKIFIHFNPMKISFKICHQFFIFTQSRTCSIKRHLFHLKQNQICTAWESCRSCSKKAAKPNKKLTCLLSDSRMTTDECKKWDDQARSSKKQILNVPRCVYKTRLKHGVTDERIRCHTKRARQFDQIVIFATIFHFIQFLIFYVNDPKLIWDQIQKFLTRIASSNFT